MHHLKERYFPANTNYLNDLKNLRSILKIDIHVYYDSEKIGFYIADMTVNNCVIIEVKAAADLCLEHEAQLTNYLKATDIEVGVLLNVGKSASFKRKVFSSEYKLSK